VEQRFNLKWKKKENVYGAEYLYKDTEFSANLKWQFNNITDLTHVAILFPELIRHIVKNRSSMHGYNINSLMDFYAENIAKDRTLGRFHWKAN
jgi:hypothetical protein